MGKMDILAILILPSRDMEYHSAACFLSHSYHQCLQFTCRNISLLWLNVSLNLIFSSQDCFPFQQDQNWYIKNTALPMPILYLANLLDLLVLIAFWQSSQIFINLLFDMLWDAIHSCFLEISCMLIEDTGVLLLQCILGFSIKVMLASQSKSGRVSPFLGLWNLFCILQLRGYQVLTLMEAF